MGALHTVLLLAALRAPAIRDGVLVCLGAALAGMASGRLVGVVVDRPPGFFPWFFAGVEALLAAALFAVAMGAV